MMNPFRKDRPTPSREARREAKLDTYDAGWGHRILRALQGRPMFEGVDYSDPAAANRLAKRRAKNKVARASRKANRR